MEYTIWQQIFLALKNQDIDVYAPGMYVGECTSPYVVLKSSGLTDTNTVSSTLATYDIMCYVPKNCYDYLEEYKAKVKSALDTLFPMLRDEHTETSDFYDDGKKAHMVSMTYGNYRKKAR